MEGRGAARQRRARRGWDGRGLARQGEERLGAAGKGREWRSVAWPRMAWPGKDGHGEAWQTFTERGSVGMSDPIMRRLDIPIEEWRNAAGEMLQQKVRIDRSYLQSVMRREATIKVEGTVAVVTIGTSMTMPGTGRSLLDVLAQIALA